MRVQLALAGALVFATGWTVGVSKFSQVLMTSAGGKFETASEQRAESFLITFGLAKAFGNLLVGAAADAHGRRVCMVVGWLAAAAMAALVMAASSWSLVVLADALLGLQQAFCWSTAIFVAVDLLGPARRGVAVGLIETLGYSAVASSGPFVSAVGSEAGGGVWRLYASLLGLALVCAAVSAGCLRESRELARREEAAVGGAPSTAAAGAAPTAEAEERAASAMAASEASATRRGAARGAVVEWPSGRRDAWPVHRMACAQASCLDPALVALCAAGLALNLSTAFAWGAMTRWLAARDGGGGGSAAVLLAYSLPKGVLQLPFGAAADRLGHRRFVIAGLVSIAASLAALAALAALAPAAPAPAAPSAGAPSALPAPAAPPSAPPPSAAEPTARSGDTVAALAGTLAFCLGAGTALAYSPLLACAAARSDPSWRASAIGTVRFWRDLGYAVGGVLLAQAVDAAGGAIWVAAALGALLTLLAAALTAWAYPAQPAPTVCRTGPSASPAFVTELSAAPVATPGTATRRYAELDEREMQPGARAPPQERVSVTRVSCAI